MRGWMAVMMAALWWMAALPSTAAPDQRERISLDSGWRFHLGDPEGSQYGTPITSWRWRIAPNGAADAAAMTAADVDTSSPGWRNATPGQDTFHGRVGFAWYRTVLPSAPGQSHALHFESVDDNATVYLNGRELLHHEGWDEPFDVRLDPAWKQSGSNVLAVLVENTNGAGGIGLTMLDAGSPDEATGPALPEFDDSSWRSVHLPHDFVVEGTFDPQANLSHGFLPAGVGWYRRTFTLPQSDRGRRIWIDFDGVYRDSRVWLNGKLLGRHPSGYTSFRYDITDAARYGSSNVLVVRADARAFEGWWYEGGGIYRHVWLNEADPLHVAPWGVFVSSDLSQSDIANLTIKTLAVNDGASAATCAVETQILDASGRVVAQSRTERSLAAGAREEIAQQGTVRDPHLWSIESPYLYHAITRILKAGRPVDRVTTPFGIRTIRFDADRGYFLNCKPVKLKGTCNHQDFAGVGTAMPDGVLEWRIKKLKEMGSNAYRCSHNPPAAELLDACDRLGMVVMDENRHLGDTYRDHTPRGTPYSNLSDLKDMILRDRNHPSIVMWSMCNEEGLQSTEEGARIFAAMKEAVLRIDPTRPITCAMNGGWGLGFSRVEDLQGCNYNPGGYDRFHETHPNMPMYGSETASAVSTRGIYANDRERGYVSAYDVNHPPWGQTAEGAWTPLAERPFMAGGFVWTGFDYKGEPTPYGWPCINSHFGIMDICGFPKDTYYYYKSWWGDRPVAHILPHWNWPGKEGQPIDVWVHSNCERVELFLSGKSLGAQEMPRNGHLEWKVPYAPGRLEARGYNGSTEAATDVVETTGPPARLRLETDRTLLNADGEDLAVVQVAVVDAQGRVVPIADNEVTFAVGGQGSVGGVGNGDPSSHEPDKASQRHALNGLCMVLVRAGDRAGGITLTATSPGLAPAHLSFRSRKPPTVQP